MPPLDRRKVVEGLSLFCIYECQQESNGSAAPRLELPMRAKRIAARKVALVDVADTKRPHRYGPP